MEEVWVVKYRGASKEYGNGWQEARSDGWIKSIMEKYTIEIETEIGWVYYHSIMRPGEERARVILKELQEKFPAAKFRIVRWAGQEI